MCLPSLAPPAGAGITTDEPCVQEPPSTRYSVRATPEAVGMFWSAAVKLTVTGVLCQAPSFRPVWLVVGVRVSIFTWADLTASTLPTLSVDLYSMVQMPSLVCDPGAVTVMPVSELYATQPPTAPRLSVKRYSVLSTPEPPTSVGVSVTFTSLLRHVAGALSVVTGAVVSILTLVDWMSSTLPEGIAKSTERYCNRRRPSLE